MCGIAGILHFGKIDHGNAITSNMANSLQHRGPNTTGFYNDAEISLGHTRLSIIDVSTKANQPFVSQNGRYVLCYNGEIYNYKAIRAALTGWEFISESDSEVVLAAFSTWGIGCLQKLDGIFAFSIWDKEEHELWLVRDRMGVKPLYYKNLNGTILFASEIRALIASNLFAPTLDNCGLTHFLSYQSVAVDFPIIAGIKELQAGTYLRCSTKGIEEGTYWSVTTSFKYEHKRYEEITSDVFKLLDNAVKKRMVSDVPIAAYLSGGIDSSAIVALLSLHAETPIHTFTLSFDDEYHDESAYAQLIAKRFQTNHTTLVLKEEELLEQVVNGLNAMDSPSADGLNTYILANAIKDKHFKVALSGIGADELFAGYPGFAYYNQLQRYTYLFNHTYLFRRAFALLLDLFNQGKFNRLNRFLKMDNSELYSIYPVLRQLLPPNKLKELLSEHTCIDKIEQCMIDQLSKVDHPAVFSRFSLAEYSLYAKHTLLKDVDQMSMANGLEVREPFFDIELIEYVLSIPDKYKIGHMPKQLLIDAVAPLLPEAITQRKKMGFVLPMKKWMQTALKSFCETQISELADRGFVHQPQLISYWKQFLKNEPGIEWIAIWQFVVLNYWMNKNNVDYQA